MMLALQSFATFTIIASIVSAQGGAPHLPGVTQAVSPLLDEDSWTATAPWTMVHFEHPTEPHCEDFTVQDAKSQWWVDNGYRSSAWAPGLCTSKYNFVNKLDHPASGIIHRLVGMKPPSPSPTTLPKQLFSAESAELESNVCSLNWNYCPRDPGCATYTMSAHEVKAFDVTTGTSTPIKVENIQMGDLISLEISGKTTLSSVPASGSFRVYSLQGGNVASGTLSDSLKLSGSDFTFTTAFKASAKLFGTDSKQMFEFGLDVFQQGSGTDEGMCVEVSSNAYLAIEKARASPAFEFLCKDGGNGHFSKLATPVPMPSVQLAGPSTCEAPKPSDYEWYYCPRDPGCKTYSMSANSVQIQNDAKSTVTKGDKINLEVKGSTTMAEVSSHASYRIYQLRGGNAATGVLADVMRLGSGVFTLSIPITITEGMFAADDMEFGLDVFLQGSGTDEGMCIEVANQHYVKEQQAKPSPAFVTECKDDGGGHFTAVSPPIPEVVTPVSFEMKLAASEDIAKKMVGMPEDVVKCIVQCLPSHTVLGIVRCLLLCIV